ncbi:cupin [Streptomyces viridiviolaceus]|uniref:Cupin domain-containing protein n=1 Tax=Streptomyces viridiviolaceus TaxID=68282 RepID=A0ABW2EA13_9ACTN|nr:cupin domain-containing protein [Streptomyces viridiviolaceus]GHB67668.1 cupin [Streptomyces viridiviolaceus]
MAVRRVFKMADLKRHCPAPGVCGQPIFGERSMIALVEFAPNAVAPSHTHPQEQIGIVTQGVQLLTIEGETYEVGAGDGYFIPSGVEHGSIAGPEGSTCIEVFQPIREDYWRAAQGMDAAAPFT